MVFRWPRRVGVCLFLQLSLEVFAGTPAGPRLVATGQIPYVAANSGRRGQIVAGTEIDVSKTPDGKLKVEGQLALIRIKKSREEVKIPLQMLLTHAEYLGAGLSRPPEPGNQGQATSTAHWWKWLSQLSKGDDSCINPQSEDICRRARNFGLGHPLWDTERSASFIRQCQSPPLKLVKRNNLAGADCRLRKVNELKGESEWFSCVSPAVCTPSQAEAVEAGYEKSLQKDRVECHFPGASHARPSPTAASRSGRKKVRRTVRATPAGKCLVPLTKPVKTLVVHHTASPVDFDILDTQKLHVQDKKFTDIAYHYMIAPDDKGVWRVYEGRSSKAQGAHGGAGLNSDSLGIVIAGNYEPTAPDPTRPITANLQPPPAAVEQLMALIEKLRSEHPSISKIKGHGEFQHPGNGCHTQCPGPGCQHLVNHLNLRFFSSGGRSL